MSTIPATFQDSERIVRILYWPKYIKKDKVSIKSNAFRTPPGKDEVSVVRLEYSSPNFCKAHGKKFENPSDERTYFGLAVLKVDEIKGCGADVKFTPDEPYNPAHADIIIGYTPIKDVQLPAEFKYKVDELAKKARLYQDPDVNHSDWVGGELQ